MPTDFSRDALRRLDFFSARFLTRLRRAVAIGAAGLAFCGVGPVLAEGIAPAVAPTAIVAAATPQARQALSVDGFRAARFGMNEKAVRAAIAADFGLKGKLVVKSENPVERTTLLSVVVPDLLPDGGAAKVAYVLGYSSKALIQIGVSWSAKTDPAMTSKMLYDNGDVLRSHFASQAYVRDSIKSNVALPNGILLFRGADAKGHATLLLLQGSYGAGSDGRKTLLPSSLDLLYSANPAKPDIFRLPKGSF